MNTVSTPTEREASVQPALSLAEQQATVPVAPATDGTSASNDQGPMVPDDGPVAQEAVTNVAGSEGNDPKKPIVESADDLLNLLKAVLRGATPAKQVVGAGKRHVRGLVKNVPARQRQVLAEQCRQFAEGLRWLAEILALSAAEQRKLTAPRKPRKSDSLFDGF